MTKSFDEIVAITQARRSEDAPELTRMRQVLERYNGDVGLLLPGVQGEPEMVPPIAQIVTESVDFNAMRAASTKPVITAPALHPHLEKGAGSLEWASTRRRTWHAIWHESGLTDVLLRRAYRHFFAYGTFHLMVMPDTELGARVELRDPLSAYPELRTPDDIHDPLNVAYVYGRSPTWIAKAYPEAKGLLERVDAWDRLWDLVEWVDGEEIVVGVVGPRASKERADSGPNLFAASDRASHMELRRWQNLAGFVPAVSPRRITLDKVMGQVWAAVGQQMHLERFTALEIAAAERYVFPDVVVVGRDGRQPLLVGGSWKDGRTGEANFIQDGDVKLLQASPGAMTMPTLDRIQENAQRTGGLIPQAYGATYGALRTGRAIDAIGGFAVDPRQQEAQEVAGRALTQVNRAIAAVMAGYYPKRKFTLFSGHAGDIGHVEVVPGQQMAETSDNVVVYPLPGSDATEATVGIGQMVSLRLMSRQTARAKHPMIENPESEERAVSDELMEDAVLQGYLQQVTAGAMPLIDAARARQLYKKGATIEEAILQANREAQERQAAAAEAPVEPGGMPPNAMAGLALPGQGVESQPASEAIVAQGAPPQGLQNAAQLIRALQAGTR